MIVVMGIFDRVLDIIGLITLVYLSWKGARWYYTRGKKRDALAAHYREQNKGEY